MPSGIVLAQAETIPRQAFTGKFMHQGLTFISQTAADDSIETIVRTALWRGELLPGAAAAIRRADQAGNLSPQDRRRLAILQDAIAHHYVRPIEL